MRAQYKAEDHALTHTMSSARSTQISHHLSTLDSARPSHSTQSLPSRSHYFFFQAEDGIRDYKVTGVQTCALPISEPMPEPPPSNPIPEPLPALAVGISLAVSVSVRTRRYWWRVRIPWGRTRQKSRGDRKSVV